MHHCTNPVFLQDLAEGDSLRVDEALQMLYVVTALHNLALQSHKLALALSRNVVRTGVDTPQDQPVCFVGKRLCNQDSSANHSYMQEHSDQRMTQRPCNLLESRGREGLRVRSRRLISSALAVTKRPARPCWAQSS